MRRIHLALVFLSAALPACASSQTTAKDPQPAPGCVASSTDDAPDPDFVDANCDGLDGTVARGVPFATFTLAD